MKRKLLWGTGITAAALAIACGGAPAADPAPDDLADPFATTAPAKKAPGLGDGTYTVPGEVRPGTYVTTVPADAINCYWARLRNMDGELEGIITNGNLAPGARGRFTVKATDKGVQLTGGCRWTVAKQ